MYYYLKYEENIPLINCREEKEAPITAKQIEKLFQCGEYMDAEDAILQCLAFHKYVTGHSLSRYINHKRRQKKREIFKKPSLLYKKLHSDGFLERYTYKETSIYTLSAPAKEYAAWKLKNLKNRSQAKEPDSTAAILECASLSAWHISLFCTEKLIRAHFREKMKIEKKLLYLPSYVELKKGGYTYHLYSDVFPKEQINAGTFFKSLEQRTQALRSFVKKRKDTIFLHVIIMPDKSTLEALSEVLHGLSDTNDMEIYYVIEDELIHTNGLSLLYRCSRTDGKVTVDTLSFR